MYRSCSRELCSWLCVLRMQRTKLRPSHCEYTTTQHLYFVLVYNWTFFPTIAMQGHKIFLVLLKMSAPYRDSSHGKLGASAFKNTWAKACIIQDKTSFVTKRDKAVARRRLTISKEAFHLENSRNWMKILHIPSWPFVTLLLESGVN